MSVIGISFPFRKESGEFPKQDYNREAVKSNIVALFTLGRRSRVMRPELGTDITSFVFESISPLLLTKIERSIRETIAIGEPRARVNSISFEQKNTKLIADIVYEVTGVEETLSVTVANQIT